MSSVPSTYSTTASTAPPPLTGDVDDYREVDMETQGSGKPSGLANAPAPQKIAGATVIPGDKAYPDKSMIQMQLPDGNVLCAYPDDFLTQDKFGELLNALGLPEDQRKTLMDGFNKLGVRNWQDLYTKFFGATAPGIMLEKRDIDTVLKALGKGEEKPAEENKDVPSASFEDVEGLFKPMPDGTTPTFDTKNENGVSVRDHLNNTVFNKIPLAKNVEKPESDILKDLNGDVSVTKAVADKIYETAKNDGDVKAALKEASNYFGKLAGNDPDKMDALMLGLTKEVQLNAVNQDFPKGNQRYYMLRDLGNELKDEIGNPEGTKMFGMGLTYLGRDGAKLYEDGEHDNERAMKEFIKTGDYVKYALPEDQGGSDWNLSKHGYDDAFDDNKGKSNHSWNILHDNGDVLRRDGKL